MYIPKTKRFQVRITDFFRPPDASIAAALRPKTASSSFNFSLKDGALKDGEGAAVFAVNGYDCEISGKQLLRLYYYSRYDYLNEEKDDRLLVYADDGRIYEKKLKDDSAFAPVVGLEFAAAPEGVHYKFNGEDVYLFSHGERLYLYDGSTVSDYAAPDVTSMCICNERLFATTGGESTTLWFSENFDPTNWYVSLNEAGFIDFQDGLGKLLKVIEHDGYAFVFRNYGITRVYAPYEQNEFTGANAEIDKVRIYGGSVADCGNRIIYLTENGFYAFDGVYSAKIATALDGFLRGEDNRSVVAAYRNGRYYALINVNVDGEKEKVLLSLDANSGEYYLVKGLDIVDIATVFEDEGKLLFLTRGDGFVSELTDDAEFYGEPCEKIWRSAFSDFGTVGRKTLAKVFVKTKGDITVTIKSDEGSETLQFSGYNGVSAATVGLVGESFSAQIKSEETGAEISSLILEFTVIT